MKKLHLTAVLFFAWSCCGCSQNKESKENRSVKLVGGGCDGCEAILEYGDKKFSWVETLPDYDEPGPKMEISGTIFQKDGKTPAPNVIFYIYHTDQHGYYSAKYHAGKNQEGAGRRHGYIRGWVKTGTDGKYKFHTLRPAPYPKRTAPAHIHAIVKEPDLNEYWVDEYLFDDDPLLTKEKRNMVEGRGGPGIVQLEKDKNGILQCHRDIVLGKNIPNY
jgi:protocatechuate 3,4-dioxygenase beta subunit